MIVNSLAIEAAKSKGIYKGRPATFDSARIVSLRKEGMGAVEIAKAVGCKRGNVYKGAQGGRAELGWQELPPQARMVGLGVSAQHRKQSEALVFWLTNEIAPPPNANSGSGGLQPACDARN